MDDDLKALAARIAKYKSKSKNKAYRYPCSIKKDVVKFFNQDNLTTDAPFTKHRQCL